MLEQVTRNWWVLALRGVLAILFAVIAFLQPGVTLTALVWLWGTYALLDGIFALVAASRAAGREQPWGMLLAVGLSGIAAGIIAFAWTGITALVMVSLVAAWAIVSGVFTIRAAVRLRRVIDDEWLLGLGGVLAILLGLLIITMPGAGLLALVWTIGAYALLFGAVMLVLAFRLRALGQREARRRASV